MPVITQPYKRKLTAYSRARSIFLAACLMLVSQSVFAAPAAKSIEFWNDSEPKSVMKVKHTVWQSILDRYLDDKHPSGVNRFNYGQVSDVDLTRLRDYLEYLQSLEPRQLNMAEQKAYWINLYNAKTVELVTRRMKSDDIDSVREIRSGIFTPGPWQRKWLKISTKELSLDDIEHGILRPHFDDKRIHYALNCASIGCPNLLKTAYTASNTDALMQKAEQEFLTHPRAVRIDNGDLVLSRLFDWYGIDFAESSEGLLAYLSAFLDEDTRNGLENRDDVRFEYDWALNRP